MGNPLKIKETGGGSFLGLQEMSSTDMNYAVHQILVQFASTNDGAGSLNVTGDASGNGTSIGQFLDTRYTVAEGTHPVSASDIQTSTTTFAQDNRTDTSGAHSDESSMTIPLHLDGNGAPSVAAGNTSVTSTLIDAAIANLVANGIGSYVVSTSQPNNQYTSIATFQDTHKAAGNTTYQLWRYNNNYPSAPSTERPAKLDGTSIKQMSDAEIKSLAARLRNRIISNNIGTYAFQSTAPESGTWVQMGGAITDTRNTCLLYTSPSPRD